MGIDTMLPFATWRQVVRVPFIRENEKAVRFLSDLFYLLIALFRTRRFSDFNRLQYTYFEMIHSFAQHGRLEAKDTVDRFLQIPWFSERRRDLYRLISSYNRAMAVMHGSEGNAIPVKEQLELNRNMEDFVQSFKALIDFDEQDEARVSKLVEDPGRMDEMLEYFFDSLL